MLLGGILEPGEQPADAVVREAYEETGVRVVPERLGPGDVPVPGVPLPLGGGRGPVDELPEELTDLQREKVRLALVEEERTWFALSAITPGVS